MNATEDMPVLPVDEEIDRALDEDGGIEALLNSGDDATLGKDDRIIAGMARALTRLVEQRHRYQRQLALMAEETELALAPIQKRIDQLQSALEGIAVEVRRSSGTKVTKVHVPGLGDISTRGGGGRARIADPEALKAFLKGDERERYLVPQPDQLDARAVLSNLAEIAKAHGIASSDPKRPVYAIPGVEYGEETVTPKIEWLA